MTDFHTDSPGTPIPLLVFTDLDGTLLDHHNYNWQAAAPALQRLEDLGCPVILNSSKTVAEMVDLRAALNNPHPFIAENGAVIAIPNGYPDRGKEGFETVFNQLKISPASYILILTRGHLFDKNVLEQSLNTNAGYIGMIGSKRKRNLIYESLLEKGFPKKAMEKVYSPVGIAINAQTPEEIAVSIVAELIQKRAPEKKAPIMVS